MSDACRQRVVEPRAAGAVASRRAHGGCALLVLCGLLAGAAPPEVVRLRVPADRARAWFPAGVELRGMALKEFDALVAAARAGAARSAEPSVPRLLRARHFARWESGVLIGRSELDVEPASRPGELALVPWTPALDGAPHPAGGVALRVEDSGRTALGIDARGLTTVTLRWQLRARPGSRGRGFTLGLPGAAVSSLELDLPTGWTPDGPAGVRRGPEPSASPGRQTWRIEGRGGLADLRFLGAPGEKSAETPVWVSGPTRVDLGESGARANWRAEWAVEADPRGPRRLDVELDPGLDLVDVTGTAVEGYQAEAAGAGTRVAVRLKEGAAGPSALTIRASTHAPFDGAWAVPAARPVGALWTGGITTVRLDPTRVLADCRERAGRRVLARPGEPVDGRLLVFEANAPRSVAELVFHKPGVDASVAVRGELFLANTEPRLQCRLSWTVHRGRLLGLDFDLPPAWVPDEVRVDGSDEPVSWHPQTLPGGGVRVHAVPSSVQLARSVVVLNVSAVARIAGGQGPLLLPRVRPVGARVADDLWLARVGPGLTLRPASAHGLAWVDPKTAAGGASEKEAAPEAAECLAWRWVADDAEARVDRERVGADPSGTVHLQARLDARRVRIDGRIEVDAGDESVRTLAIGLTETLGAADRWRFADEDSGLPVPARPLAESSRDALGLPGRGPAWELELPANRRGALTLRVRYDGEWGGEGHVPLVVLPTRVPTRGDVSVLVDRVVRSSADATGLTVLDPATAGPPLGLDADSTAAEGTAPTYRRAHAYGYFGATAARLLVRTEALEPLRREGVIQAATLTTFDAAGGPRRHRLTLRLAADQAQSLELTMPAGVTLVRLRRDGQPVAPARSGRGLSVPLPVLKAQRTHCTVTLDYSEAPGLPGPTRPTLPKLAWPCVSFCWTVASPPGRSLSAVGRGFSQADPTPRRSWAERAFGPWYSPWSGSARAPVPDDASGVLVELDRRVAALRPEEMTLGEWLTRWDANRWPLVVDRMTLATAGWGPRSRVMPPGLDPTRPGAAKAALAPLGLTVVPVGVSLLITTLDEAPDRGGGPLAAREARLAWERALRQASVWGSDLSDRFQSVTRWREELSPRYSGDDPWDREPLDASWRTWRFAAAGWPGPDAWIGFRDDRASAATTSAIALALMGLAVLARNRPVRARVVVAALVLGAGLEALADGGEGLAAFARGAVLGGSGALVFWLARTLPTRAAEPAGSRASRVGSAARRQASGSAWRAVGIVALLGAAAASALAQSGAGPVRILALLPYDGPPDLTRPPDRVLLRLDDYERLRSLVAPRAELTRGVTASGARHRVDWHATDEAVVESEYDLTRADGPPEPWRVPVEHARDVSATLDGAPAPLAIRGAGAREGEVFVSGPGRHRLLVRRRVRVRADERGVGFSLPVNAVADARVEVLGEPAGPPVEVPSARGGVKVEGGRAEGLLGPTDRLELHWPSPPDVEKAAPATAAEGLVLWDAEPAGDYVRARLTLRNPAGVAALRVRTEPGVAVRASGIPGRVDVSWEGTDKEPEWVATVEPPLPDRSTVMLEFWRPAGARDDGAGANAARSVPVVEPLGVRRFSGALAFRRPAQWAGRLASSSGEPITDEAFARQWGALPDDPLTLAGTTRFVGRPSASLVTGPVAARVSVQPEVQLHVGPGRIDVQLKGDLVEAAGRVDRVELRIPAGLRVIAVEAGGLTDWSRTKPDRLRLRFDGAPAGARTVRVQAWLPVAADPLAVGPLPQEVDVPWPRWEGVADEQGTLVVTGRTEPRVDGSGVTLVSRDQTGAAVASSVRHRATYRVERPEAVGRLHWDTEPPKVGVLVQSRLTVHPESAEWLAVLRYTVSGGAADVIHLNVPTAWAARADVRLAGDGRRLSAESRGETTRWTIRPQHPVWGTERLVIRSSLPRPARQPLAFPDVVPLGRGTADAYLAVVNGTARDLLTESVAGVQAVDYAAGFRDAPLEQPPAGLVSAYRVLEDGWRLRVQPPTSGVAADGAPAVSLADVVCTLAADGASTGVASYALGPHAGPFLAVRVPERCDVLGVTLDGTPVPLLRTPAGRFLVPVGGVGATTVNVLFGTAPGGAGALAFPTPAQADVPALVTIRAPEAAVVSAAAGSLEPAGPDRLALERAAWLERQVGEALERFDPGSLRDREALVSSIVAFELSLRTAERSVIWNLSGTPGDRDERLRRVQERVRSVRSALARKVEAAGAEDLLAEAHGHAGLTVEGAEEPVAEVAPPNRAGHVRQLGRPSGFLGTSSALSQPRALSWTTPSSHRTELWVSRAAALAAALSVLAGYRLLRTSARVRPLLLALLVAAIAAVGGPSLLAAALCIAAVGRVVGPG